MKFKEWINSEEAFWIVQRFGLSIAKDGMMLQEVFNAAAKSVSDAKYDEGYENGAAHRYIEGWDDGYDEGYTDGKEDWKAV